MNNNQYVSNKIHDFYKNKYKNKYKHNNNIGDIDISDKSENCDSYLNKEEYISNEINDFYKNKYKQKSINENLIDKHIIEKQKGGINKIYTNLKVRICNIVADKKLNFKFSYLKLIGCSIEEFEIFIKTKFKEGMSIDNYGEWELDHIYPISKFDLSKEDEILKCFNYKNIQPLWKL